MPGRCVIRRPSSKFHGKEPKRRGIETAIGALTGTTHGQPTRTTPQWQIGADAFAVSDRKSTTFPQ
jgi:hypothetical protein